MLTNELFSTSKLTKTKTIKPTKTITKISYVIIILILFILPLSMPVNGSWVTVASGPPTILNGGTTFGISTDDWPEALEWLKNNTSQDAVIASWWDYGYWISTLGERKTLADNATIHFKIIQNIAKAFLSEPDRAWEMLQEMDADYVLIFIS
jgi:dolichyl-diphosphooligosaccharide--protein glycosyltransferase